MHFPTPRVALWTLIGAVALGVSACEPSGPAAPARLRFSGIPDADKAMLLKNAEVVQGYLSEELGMEVEFVESASYPAACNGVASNKLDLAWLGGVTSVQAENRSDGQVTLVACRASDLEFRSHFIANKAAIAAGRVRPVQSLSELKDLLPGCTFTFGSKSSTSGRVMPQYFMEQAGIDVHSGVRGGPKFQTEGGHTATLSAVNSGAVDVGVLNYKTYDLAPPERRENAQILFTTEPFVDYCLVAHNRLGQPLIDKIRAAFIKLSPDNPRHARVLAAFSAERFVAADAKDWDQIRAVLKKIKLR